MKVELDRVFDKEENQEAIFDYLKDIPDYLFKGVNSTVLAYGQTGSGKPSQSYLR